LIQPLLHERPRLNFKPYGLPHLTVIFITIVLPFALAALVRRTKSQRIERVIVVALSVVLILNYLAYLVFHSQPGRGGLAADVADANVRLGHGRGDGGNVDRKPALV